MGIIAPPAMPIMSKALPILVSLPRLFIARGQIAGHIIAFAKPSRATKSTDVNPFAKIIKKENTIPNIADTDKYFS